MQDNKNNHHYENNRLPCNTVRNYLKEHNKASKITYLAGYHASGNLFQARQFPEGFTAFQLSSRADWNTHWMFDSGRELAIANPEPMWEVPPELDVTRSRSRRRYKKRTLQLWRQLFPEGENIEICRGNIQVVSRLSQDISAITVKQFRTEYYLPFAYLNKEQLTGGNYLHVWEAGTNEQFKQQRPAIKDSPIKEFFTGSCMFGAPLYGVDQFGHCH
ncbi:MAG: hypothetical protein MI749_04765, partial [Desulfovibrionales bacterium]|nr:hypothetical protein [Desulfovibrionales bacterium]